MRSLITGLAFLTVLHFSSVAFGLAAPPGGGWYFTTGAPPTSMAHSTSAVVALPVAFEWNALPDHTAAEGLAYVTIDVTDAMGAVQVGTVTYDDGGVLVWTGAQDFVAGQTYTVHFVARNQDLTNDFGGASFFGDLDHTMELIIGMDPEPPITSVNTTPSLTLDAQWVDACVVSHETVLRIAVDFGDQGSYYSASFVGVDGGTCREAVCNFANNDAAEYCATVTVESVFDLMPFSELVCLPVADRTGTPSPVGTCNSGDVGMDVGADGGTQLDRMDFGPDAGTGGDGGEDDCGCSVRKAQTDTPWGALIGFACVFGLIGAGRRRR